MHTIRSREQGGLVWQASSPVAMVHISDIAARTMGIGYGGDRQIPLLDPYAQRL